MKRLPLFLFLSGMFWNSPSYGQDYEQNYDYAEQQVNNVVPVSPNATSLGIFGSVPVGHYTGVPNISIPLYEIQSGDLKVPIKLSYHASGVKLAQEASFVGLGWALNAGGCIIREIKHWGDFGSDYWVNGIGEVSIEDSYYSDPEFPESNNENGINVHRYENDGNPINNTLINLHKYLFNKKDSEPDIFRYNFCNMTGSFFFKNAKDKKAEATISNKDVYLKIIYDVSEKSFEFTDAYGNRYFFGSSETTREKTTVHTSTRRSLPSTSEPRSVVPPRRFRDPQVLTAWYLDKVITSQKDTITFQYEKEEIYRPINVSEDVSYMIDGAKLELQSSGGSYSSTLDGAYKYYNLTYTENEQLLLRKISFNDGDINLGYSSREDIESTTQEKARKANDLTVVDKLGNVVKKVKFNYSYLGSNHYLDNTPEKYLRRRLLLDGVDMVIPEHSNYVDHKYIFYYNRNSLPPKNANTSDHWGYCNGLHEKYNVDFHYSPSIKSGKRTFEGIDKNADEIFCQYGILTSIQYPTGGRTDFTYELNEFANGFDDSMDSVKSGGGLRIRKICDLASNTDTTSVRSFIYTKDGKSSGILMTVPKYHYFFNLIERRINVAPGYVDNFLYIGHYINVTSNPYAPIMGSASGMYVGYSYVEEKNSTHDANEGYITYSFKNKANQSVGTGEMIVRNYPSIAHMDNGLPTNVTYFDKDNNPVKRTDFEYLQVERDSIKGLMLYMMPMALGNFHGKFYDVYSERWVLNKETETLFFPGNKSVTATTEYEYDPLNWLKNYEKTTVDEDVYETQIKYPTNNPSNDNILSGMVSKNMIGIPIEITRKKNGNVISGEKTTFRTHNDMYLPYIYYQLDTDSGNYYKQSSVDLYDAKGKILQYSNQNNIPTTYLWSYNGRYPIAEIKNATFSQVTTAFGSNYISAISNLTAPSAYDFYELDLMRSRIPNAQMTIYRYEPLVGISNITDPSGRKIWYEYDEAGRLERIKDDKYKIVNEYKYKYNF